MEEKLGVTTSSSRGRTMSPPPLSVPPPSSSGQHDDGSISKPTGQNCLCAPTTHAGSFRCHLHRLPARKTSSPKLPLPKAKLPLHQKAKPGARHSSLRSGQGARLSRLSKAGAGKVAASEHQQQEASIGQWKSSPTEDTRQTGTPEVAMVSVSSSNNQPCPWPSLVRSNST